MAGILLRTTTDLTQLMTNYIIHPIYYPYPLGLVLHASRVSIAYQSNVINSGSWGRIHWGTYLAGFLVMGWAGSIWSNLLLGLYPPQLYSINSWIGYLSVHLFLTAVIPHIQNILSPRILDTVLVPIDAILRLTSITTALSLLQSHPDDRLSQSLFLQLFIGSVASAGGGITAATLEVWTPEWKFGTPVVLKGGWIASVDFWGGIITTFTYGLLTASHPTYQHFLYSLSITSDPGPVLTPLGARAAATIVLSTIFFWRALAVHWVIRKVPEVKLKSQ